jgi:hypothetical protein
MDSELEEIDEDAYLETWQTIMQKKPDQKEKAQIHESIERSKKYRSIYSELVEKYGEHNNLRVWELILAIDQNQNARGLALFQALEDDLP